MDIVKLNNVDLYYAVKDLKADIDSLDDAINGDFAEIEMNNRLHEMHLLLLEYEKAAASRGLNLNSIGGPSTDCDGCGGRLDDDDGDYHVLCYACRSYQE